MLIKEFKENWNCAKHFETFCLWLTIHIVDWITEHNWGLNLIQQFEPIRVSSFRVYWLSSREWSSWEPQNHSLPTWIRKNAKIKKEKSWVMHLRSSFETGLGNENSLSWRQDKGRREEKIAFCHEKLNIGERKRFQVPWTKSRFAQEKSFNLVENKFYFPLTINKKLETLFFFVAIFFFYAAHRSVCWTRWAHAFCGF